MSLFGSSPPETGLPESANRKSSLFDDDHKASAKSGNGLFDDEAVDGGSPWSMPTPKKGGRGDLVKSLLPATNVPENYVDAFDVLSNSDYRAGGGQVNMEGIRKLLESTRISPDGQGKILSQVTADKKPSSLGRNEFNVLLALIGLSLEGEEATLDSVDERRKNLPNPSLPFIAQLKHAKVSDNLEDASTEQSKASSQKQQSITSTVSPGKSRRMRKDSLENLDADPWASPEMHKGHTHEVNNEETPADSTSAAKPIRNGFLEPSRTTSTFTTHSPDPGPGGSTNATGDSSSMPSADEGTGGWGSLGGSEGGLPSSGTGGLGGEGFGSGGGDRGQVPGGASSRSLGGGRRTGGGIQETIVVTLLPEKEGVFLFQHHNYEVKSMRRGNIVVRRYSDFVWLLNCLHKRYPFRQLPLLPPKTLGVNGNHLSSDATFIEKRRRGLVRFTNALVRHPVLSQEQLVVMFLTVPTELAVWRKQATISVQEEFVGRALPPDLEDSLPTNLEDTFATVRTGVRQSAEHYINLCTLMERLTKRNLGIASDQQRFSQALVNLTEASRGTYATDTNDVPLLNEGINSTAKHLNTSQSLLEDEAKAWDEGVLEDFKKQRDTLVSVRDMFDRRERYAKDNIPQLERRIENNKNKLAALVAGSGGKPGEQEKLEEALRADKQSIIEQHARGVFIKECVRDELAYFQQSQYQVSRMHQDWSQERVKYAELQAENWRALSEQVDNMPVGE